MRGLSGRHGMPKGTVIDKLLRSSNQQFDGREHWTFLEQPEFEQEAQRVDILLVVNDDGYT